MSIPSDVSNTDVLRSVTFLADARPESVAILEQRCRRLPMRRGEFLFQEGAPCSRVFVIVRGAVSAQTTSPQGALLILNVAGPGETPGHLDALGRVPYSSSAVALRDTEVLVIAGDDFGYLLDHDSTVLRALALDLAGMVRVLSRTITDLAFLDLPRRVARLLLDLAGDDHRPTIVLTQGDIAARLAAARQSVNQALGLLARARLITVGEAGSVTGIDIVGLQAFVESAPR